MLVSTATMTAMISARPIRTGLTPRARSTSATAAETKSRTPWRTPQPIEPSSHSPRNSDVPMIARNAAMMTRATAAATRPAKRPPSRPISLASSLARSTWAIASRMPAWIVARSCSRSPGRLRSLRLRLSSRGGGGVPGGGGVAWRWRWPTPGGGVEPVGGGDGGTGSGSGGGVAPAAPGSSGVGSVDSGCGASRASTPVSTRPETGRRARMIAAPLARPGTRYAREMPQPHDSRRLLTAETLSIGTELTVGDTRDTNAGELARAMTAIGPAGRPDDGPPRRSGRP